MIHPKIYAKVQLIYLEFLLENIQAIHAITLLKEDNGQESQPSEQTKYFHILEF